MIEMDDEITEVLSNGLIEIYLPNLAPIAKRSSLETRRPRISRFIGHFDVKGRMCKPTAKTLKEKG